MASFLFPVSYSQFPLTIMTTDHFYKVKLNLIARPQMASFLFPVSYSQFPLNIMTTDHFYKVKLNLIARPQMASFLFPVSTDYNDNRSFLQG